MSADLKKELRHKTKELAKSKSELKLVEDKLDYCQNRLLDIRNEKDELLKKVQNYELMGIDLKVLEYNELKDNFLKLEHRYKVTKELLDNSREETTILKNVVEDFKNLSFFNFIKNNYPNSLNTYNIKFNKYNYNYKKK